MTFVKRLDIRHVRNHALEGIATRRLGVSPDYCLLGIWREDGAIIVHVNSGGNVCAVETRLNLAGYRAEGLPFDPDVYGGKVRVTLREARGEGVACHFCVNTDAGLVCRADLGGLCTSRAYPAPAVVKAGDPE